MTECLKMFYEFLIQRVRFPFLYYILYIRNWNLMLSSLNSKGCKSLTVKEKNKWL